MLLTIQLSTDFAKTLLDKWKELPLTNPDFTFETLPQPYSEVHMLSSAAMNVRMAIDKQDHGAGNPAYILSYEGGGWNLELLFTVQELQELYKGVPLVYEQDARPYGKVISPIIRLFLNWANSNVYKRTLMQIKKSTDYQKVTIDTSHYTPEQLEQLKKMIERNGKLGNEQQLVTEFSHTTPARHATTCPILIKIDPKEIKDVSLPTDH